MVARGELEHARFVERFVSMVDSCGFDARAEGFLPLMVDRLHEVERDDFALGEVTRVSLPEWIRPAR